MRRLIGSIRPRSSKLAFCLVGAGIAGASVLVFNAAFPTEAKENSEKKHEIDLCGVDSVLKAEFAQFLLNDQMEVDIQERKQRGKPWNSYHSSKEFPQMILYPESTEQVSKIMKLCKRFDVPLVPFGGGTSLEGQTMTPMGSISLDFSRMKRIVELNEDDLDVHVEAGLGYVELNEILKPRNLWFPLDPGPGASIGGGKA